MRVFCWGRPIFESFLSMKYLIVGLGNVGDEYAHTRHNIGFDVVASFIQKHQGQFAVGRLAYHAEIKWKGKIFICICPTTYMNLSGKAVKYWMTQEKILAENICIVTDDIHIDFGSIRIKTSGSAGGHNGLKDIQEKLKENLTLPAGYFIEYGGAFENLQRATSRLKLVLPIALALIFILIFFALKSMKQTFMIYIAIPLAAIGGVFSLLLRGMPFSISAGIGFIALFWFVHIWPDTVAKRRQHPQRDAIHALCVLSLFFGGLLWPFAYLWAYTRPTMYKLAYGTDRYSPVEEDQVNKESDSSKA